MKISVEFLGFPNVVSAVGGKKLDLEFNGKTVQDLLDTLVTQYGPKIKESFYDTDGAFDPNVQVILNGEEFLSEEGHDTPLSKGDHVVFMLVLAGG